MLKPQSKKKRNKREVEEVKQEEELLKEDKQGYFLQVKRLKQEKEEAQAQAFELNQMQRKFAELQEAGFLDEHGNPRPL